MPKINWKTRVRNPQYLVQIGAAILVPVGAYLGITAEDLSTWPALGSAIVDAVSNPYVVFTAAVAAYNATNDPTTEGIRDSQQALSYEAPKKRGE